jgi:hypothetical protein
MVSTPGGTGEFLDAKTLLLLSNDDSGGALVHAIDVTGGTSKLWTMVAGPGTVLTGKISVDRTIPLVYVVADGIVRAFDPSTPTMPSSQFSVGGLPTTGMIFATERSEPCSYYVGTSEGEVRLVNFENFKEGSTACNFLTSESEGHEDRIKAAQEEDAQSGEDQPTQQELLAALDSVLSQPKPVPEDEEAAADDGVGFEVTADGGSEEDEQAMILGADFSPALGGDDDADSVALETIGDTPPGESGEEPVIPKEVPCEDLEEQDEGPGEVFIEDGAKGTKGMEDEDWVSDEDFDQQQRENEWNSGPPSGGA